MERDATESARAPVERRVERRHGPGKVVRDALYGLLRWIERHVRGFYAAIGAYLVIGLVVVFGGLLTFLGIAEGMTEGVTTRFDERVLLWMDAHATPQLTVAALEVTALGAGLVVWMVISVASAFLWTSRHRWSVALLWVAMLGAGLVNSTLKAFYDRPRPDLFEWRTPYAGHASFPSGHSMTGMVVYATLAYLVARLEPSRTLRRLTIGVAAVVIVLIGLSRMYLGVHYPTDVIAGFVTGIMWAAFCALGIEAVRYFRGRRPKVEAEEKDLDAERERALGVRG